MKKYDGVFHSERRTEVLKIRPIAAIANDMQLEIIADTCKIVQCINDS